jgi:hypothetical protein
MHYASEQLHAKENENGKREPEQHHLATVNGLLARGHCAGGIRRNELSALTVAIEPEAHNQKEEGHGVQEQKKP